jgi:histone H3/H4
MGTTTDPSLEREILVVVSKLKAFVRARSGMNTSDGVANVLSDHLRDLCGEAIRNAARDGRRTVMDRDFVPLITRKP